MVKLIPVILYLQAFVNTLVIPCVTNPSNWEACFSDWDIWLIPEVQRLIDKEST